jgi:calcineurin-like phosphoesterase family protein
MKIQINKRQKLFFTSDTHFGHKNICRGTSFWPPENTRDFDTVQEMNEEMVSNINRVVGEEDFLFHLGDFSFDGFENIEHFRRQIKCRNLHLLLGNHDHHIRKDHDGIRSLFSSVNDYLHLQVVFEGENGTVKYPFVLCHYPIASWDGLRSGTMHLHGHVHFDEGKVVGPGRMLDVGMDGNGLGVWSLEDVLRALECRPKVSMFSQEHHSDF